MGCGIIFLSDNRVDDANITITTGTVNEQFPLANIKNESPAVRFRSNENNVVLQFDLQQTRTIDSYALHGDTNGTLGLTAASVRYSFTTDFSGSPVINIPLSAENLIGYQLEETAVSARYIELTLTGSGSFAEVSNFYVGEKIEIEQNTLSIDSFRYGLRDKSTAIENKYGQRFIDKRNKLKFVGGGIQFCTKDEQETLDDLFIQVGRSEPLWMIVDKDSAGLNDGQYKLTVYGYLEAQPEWSASGGQHYNTDIRVNQAG